MKKVPTYLAFCAAALFLVQPLAAQQQALSAEERKIVDVIEDESKYFWNRNYEAWANLYVQEPYVVWTASTKDGVRRFDGWNAWRDEVKRYFAADPDPMPYNGVVYKYNYRFRIYKNGAWVSFEQMNDGTKTYETRILEKEKGNWKIAMVQLIYNANESETLVSEGDNQD